VLFDLVWLQSQLS